MMESTASVSSSIMSPQLSEVPTESAPIAGDLFKIVGELLHSDPVQQHEPTLRLLERKIITLAVPDNQTALHPLSVEDQIFYHFAKQLITQTGRVDTSVSEKLSRLEIIINCSSMPGKV